MQTEGRVDARVGALTDTQAQAKVQENAPRPWLRAACWLAFLGPFFFLSYGFANWWTTRLPQVDSFWFAWEKQIPFLPWTILPYMSIDAFYAASLFICTSRAELDTHARRLLAATLISVCGFLLFPMQFAFVRPETSGFNGFWFELLNGFDKPYNQAPSLHVSLLMLLWARYARHLRGWPLWLLHGWFLLIGISIFTTYQHHVIDGVWGVLVGVICFYLFPEPEPGTASIPARLPLWPLFPLMQRAHPDGMRRNDLARLYFGGALFCWATAMFWQGRGWLLLWPLLALLLVSLAYARLDVAVFQKRHGRLSVAAQVLLAPFRLGCWYSSRWFSRNDAPMVEVAPGLCIGRAPGGSDWRSGAPGAVLDLTAEFNASRAALALPYASVPMLDLVVPGLAQLQLAVAQVNRLQAGLADGGGNAGPLLVHCALGYSRSALVAAAWLLENGRASGQVVGITPAQEVASAVAQVRAVRAKIVLPPAFLALLEEYVGSLVQG